MVKAIKLPSARRVASLAACGASAGALRRHAVAKLAAMWIHVTAGAGKVLESVLHRNRCRSGLGLHMALGARNRQVRSRERESRLLVTCQCKMRRLEPAHVVAVIALIQVWCAGELSLVNILMAILAGRLHNFVNDVLSLALGDVALVALDSRVLSFQGVSS